MRSATAAFLLAAAIGAAGSASIARLSSGPAAVLAQAQAGQAYRLADVWRGAVGPRAVGFVRQPGGLVVAPDGTVFLADVGRGVIHVWRGEGFVDAFAERGSAPGQLESPRGLALFEGDVLVADTGNGRVQRFTTGGRFVAAWPGLGEPWDVAATPDGLVLVTDRAGDRVLVLDREGRRVGVLGATGTEPGQLRGPLGIDVWPDGRIGLIDGGNRRLQVWQADGTPLAVITDTSDLPLLDVAAFGDNGALVAGLRRLIHYDLASAGMRGVSVAPVPGGFAAVAVLPDAAAVPTPTIYAALSHDYLTGLRRFHSGALAPFTEWLGLPGPVGELVSPRRIAVAADTVYMLDAWPRLQRWSAAGQPLDQMTLALASDAEPAGDDLIVATSDSVRRLSGADTLWTWRPTTDTMWVGAVAVDGPAERVFVLDLMAQAVRVLGGDGAEQASWSLHGGAAGYASITDMALRPDGRLLLVDRTRAALEAREPGDGAVVGAWPLRGVPLRVAPAPDGSAFVLTREGWVWKLDAAGTIRSWWSVAAEAPDGSAAPTDLAVTADGRVLILDGAGNRVLVFAADPDGVPPSPPPDTGCSFTRDKRAAPPRIPLGETVAVTLSITGLCVDQGAEADVILVLDRSGSMRGAKMETAKAAAVTFVGEMDFTVARVGLVAFDTVAELLLGLTADAREVVGALAAMPPPDGGTDIGEGIQLAAAELADRGRPDVRQVIVVMTDGRPEGHDVDADEAARLAKEAGVRIYSIGFGTDVDPELMRRLATDPRDYFFAPSTAELSGIYTEVARRISGGVVARSMVITDVVPSNMVYLPGSAAPPVTSFQDNVLRWDVPVMSADVELSYRLRPTRVGRWPTNVDARSRYRDGLGVEGELVFPVPFVTVVAPPEPIYLPLALRSYCRPGLLSVDVALVLDTSSSMTGAKLEAAKAAARAFVNRLDLPDDRAAVIGFNRTATLAAPLGRDVATLLSAIDGLTIVRGTVIDAGLRLAVAELTGERARSGSNRVIVLLTDGVNNAGPGPVLRAAEAAAAAGLVVYTVALGDDADRDLMRTVAGDPARAYVALEPQDLERIYAEIAGRLDCLP